MKRAAFRVAQIRGGTGITIAITVGIATGVGLGLGIGSALSSPAWAGEADVLAVKLKCRELVCDFAVTLEHADEGWNHYADAWEVLGEDRQVLAKRVLQHPHVNEQPFTRSLPGVALPAGTTRVIVRAHDKQHGHGGAEVTVEIPRDESPRQKKPAEPARKNAADRTD